MIIKHYNAKTVQITAHYVITAMDVIDVKMDFICKILTKHNNVCHNAKRDTLVIIRLKGARNAQRIVKFANLLLNAQNVIFRLVSILKLENAIVLLDTRLIFQVKMIRSK